MSTTLSSPVATEDIAAIRAFSRFFTRRAGLLRPGYLDSPWSVTEVRVLYELLHRRRAETVDLRRELDIDGGQLSRVLAKMEEGDLVTRSPSAEDARRQVVALTESGDRAAAMMNERSEEQIRELTAHLSRPEMDRLVSAMATVRRLFGDPEADRAATVVLRPLRAGDLGWVVERNGAIYAEEYGWDQTYEALVAQIVADYGNSRQPGAEDAWIAEVGGERVGCVFCARKDASTAKLRLLLVEPSARGLGVGGRLVDQCLSFARSSGYRRMSLWTNDCLTAARRIYDRAGFELVSSEPHHSFGQDLVGEVWERDL